MHDVLGFMYNIAKVVLVAAVVLAADCWRVELTASAGVVCSSSHFATCRIVLCWRIIARVFGIVAQYKC